jgi:excisionase family DNA binding protein
MTESQTVVYTADEAARLLRMSVWTLREKCREGLIPHHKDGRIFKLTQADIDTYLAHTRQVPSQEGT